MSYAYSYVSFPPGVRSVTMKPRYHFRYSGLAAIQLNRETWCVYQMSTGIVKAIYYSKRNQHGWSASEAHAKSHVLRAGNFNPFELDLIA